MRQDISRGRWRCETRDQ